MGNFFGRVHLRNNDRIGAGCRCRGDVVGVPLRTDSVNADRDFLSAIFTTRRSCTNTNTRFGFGVGRHGIFKVKDQRIGGNAFGFFKSPLICAWHVENRTTGTQRFIHIVVPQSP